MVDQVVDVGAEVEDEVDVLHVDVEVSVADLDVDVEVSIADLDVDVEVTVVDVDVYVEDAVGDLDVDVEDAVVVDERVQDDNGNDEVEGVDAEVDAVEKVLVYDVAIAVRKLVVPEWLLPIQDEDVGLWDVEPNNDKMRKHSEMMQVDVHCCQVEKEVAILDVEEEVCIAQLSVDEEAEEGSAVGASDASSLPLVEACCHLFAAVVRCSCLSSRLCCHLFSLMAPM